MSDDEVAEEIWVKAENCLPVGMNGDAGIIASLRHNIQMALIAERERCAACCHTTLGRDEFVMMGPAGIARQIEAAIRRGWEPA